MIPCISLTGLAVEAFLQNLFLGLSAEYEIRITALSHPSAFSQGVPQGFILGSTFFNDVCSMVDSLVQHQTDDRIIYPSSLSKESLFLTSA